MLVLGVLTFATLDTSWFLNLISILQPLAHNPIQPEAVLEIRHQIDGVVTALDPVSALSSISSLLRGTAQRLPGNRQMALHHLHQEQTGQVRLLVERVMVLVETIYQDHGTIWIKRCNSTNTPDLNVIGMLS